MSNLYCASEQYHLEYFGTCGLVFQELKTTLSKYTNVKFFDIDIPIDREFVSDFYKFIVLQQVGDLLEIKKFQDVFEENLNYYHATGKKKNIFIILSAYTYNVEDYERYKDIIKIIYIPTWYSEYTKLLSCNENELSSDLKFKFLSLNGRTSLLRTSLYAYFYSRDLLKDSIFSYSGYCYGVKNPTVKRQLVDMLNYGARHYLQDANEEKFLQTIPYIIENDHMPNGGDCSLSNIEWYNQSFCNLTAETYKGEHNPFFTEKIFKPIAAKQIFMLFGSKHSLKFLHSLGFKTFEPYIDESYDSLDQPDRFNKILENVYKISQKTLPELARIKQECQPILDHNFNHFYHVLPKQYQIAIKQVQEQLRFIIESEQENLAG